MEIKFENSIIVELCSNRQCLAACLSCSTTCLLQIPHDRTFVFLVSMALHFSHPLFLVFLYVPPKSFPSLRNAIRSSISRFLPVISIPSSYCEDLYIMRKIVILIFIHVFSTIDFFYFSCLVMKNNFSYFLSI